MKKRQTSTNHSSSNHSSEDQICEDVGRVTFVRNNSGEVYAKSDSDHPAVQKVIEHIMSEKSDTFPDTKSETYSDTNQTQNSQQTWGYNGLGSQNPRH